MGQKYSCKCNNENEHKNSELQLEGKEPNLIEIEKKPEIKPEEQKETKAKSSMYINKTLEVINNIFYLGNY